MQIGTQLITRMSCCIFEHNLLRFTINKVQEESDSPLTLYKLKWMNANCRMSTILCNRYYSYTYCVSVTVLYIVVVNILLFKLS